MIVQVVENGIVIEYEAKPSKSVEDIFEKIRNIHGEYELKFPGKNIIIRFLSDDGIYMQFGRFVQ